MDTRNTTRGGHSADVRMALAVNGHVFSVAELGPGFVVLRNPIAHPPAEAELFLSIDGHERRWQVDLLDGIVADGGDTRFRSCVEHVNGAAGGSDTSRLPAAVSRDALAERVTPAPQSAGPRSPGWHGDALR